MQTYDENERIPLLKYIKKNIGISIKNESYFEFGLYGGRSFLKTISVFGNSFERYIGFDSFEGLPTLTSDDKKTKHLSGFKKGQYSYSDYDQLIKNFIDAGVSTEKLLIYKGWFEDVLTLELQKKLDTSKKAGIVHIDCDLYSSAKIVLEWIYPFLKTGTWLLMDDWWCFRGSSSAGEQRALSEFLSEHKDIKVQDYCTYRGWSKAFVVEKLD